MTSPSAGAFVDDAHRYQLDSRIATGGMGEVWRATDTTLGRKVAVKLLKPEYADDPTFRSRFQTEARHAAALHHPGVAAVYDFGEAAATDGSGVPRPYLVMELVDGQPLSALLRDERALDPLAVRDLLAQAADAIGVAHAAGIVHRDVKPANLMVTPTRQVKITDFGIARATEGMGLTQTGEVMGTPQYLSPEQARGNTATPASDVYSLGVVAFECLTGRRPFVADSPIATALAHLNQPVPDLPADVPADLAAVVRRALAKDPADRYPDAAAFAAALRDPATAATQIVAPGTTDQTRVFSGVAPVPYSSSPTTATPVVSPVSPATRRKGPLGLILLGLVLVALVIAIVVLALSNGGSDAPTDRPTASSSAGTVTIDEDTYIGRPVGEVRDELTALGLQVNTEPVTNPGGETAGLVTTVNPTGRLNEGDKVTVSYWGEPPAPSESPSRTPTQSQSATPSETPTPTPTLSATSSPSPSQSPSPATTLPATIAPSSTTSDNPATQSNREAPRR